MNKDIKLGFKLAQLKDSYKYKDLLTFIKGESENCMYYDTMKELYDEFGYELVNKTILEFEKPEKESRPQEKVEVETR